MALDRFRDIVATNEADMIKKISDDTREYGIWRYGRVRVNVDGDGFVRNLGNFHHYEDEYRMGRDAYLLAAEMMEEMCMWRVPSVLSQKEMCCCRRLQSTAMMYHIVQHVFDCNIFDLVEKEGGYLLATLVRGYVYPTRIRIKLYRRFLLGLVKYFVDKNVVQYLPDVVFDRFLAVFGNYVNWIPGRVAHPIFSNHAYPMPLYEDILLNLSGLVMSVKKEMYDFGADPDTLCSDDPCFVAGEVNRYFFSICEEA